MKTVTVINARFNAPRLLNFDRYNSLMLQPRGSSDAHGPTDRGTITLEQMQCDDVQNALMAGEIEVIGEPVLAAPVAIVQPVVQPTVTVNDPPQTFSPVPPLVTAAPPATDVEPSSADVSSAQPSKVESE